MENFDYKQVKDGSFYKQKDDDDYLYLTHVTRGDPKSVLTKGLLSGSDARNPNNSNRNYGSSAGSENSFIWADSASKAHHYGGPRVLLKLPRSKYKYEKLNDSEYGVQGPIDPADIYGMDYPMPVGGGYVSETSDAINEMSDYYQTDDGKEDLRYPRQRIRDEFPADSYYSLDDFKRFTPFLNWDEDDASELFQRDLRK